MYTFPAYSNAASWCVLCVIVCSLLSLIQQACPLLLQYEVQYEQYEEGAVLRCLCVLNHLTCCHGCIIYTMLPPPQQQSNRFVAERSDQSETLISVSIPEKAGSFLELYANIFPRNVTEFSYRYSGGSEAHIYMSFQVRASVCVFYIMLAGYWAISGAYAKEMCRLDDVIYTTPDR